MDDNILTVDSSGLITPKGLGIAKVKITDTTNGYFTYIIVEVIDGITASKVKIGKDFTLTLKENGTVWFFGDNGISKENEPYQVTKAGKGLENIVDIGAGNKISIALDNSGKVYTWGNIKYTTKISSTNEQTGEITETYEDKEEKIEEPTEVVSLNNVIAIDAFGDNFYAVDSDGFAYVWGKGYSKPTKIDSKYKMADVDGELLLGENGFAFNIDKPNERNNYLNSIVSISYSEDHLLFAKADGRVLSMGEGEFGQLGSGCSTKKNYANFVKTDENTYLENCYEVSSENRISMAVSLEGTVYVWGDNTKRKLGQELLKVMYASEVSLVQDKSGNDLSLPKFKLAEAGTNHMAISDTEGFVYTIGQNTFGELGLSDTKDRTNFTKIGELDIITVPKLDNITVRYI